MAGRRVLELGAGTGYLAVLCAKYLSSAHVVASDGSDDVLANLADNLALNGVGDSARVGLGKIKWGDDGGLPRWDGAPAHVIVGADITYDRSAMPALLETMAHLLGLRAGAEAYVSMTQRNAHTVSVFLEACHGNGLHVEPVRFPVPRRDQQQGPFYADQVNIHIYRVTRARLGVRGRDPSTEGWEALEAWARMSEG